MAAEEKKIRVLLEMRPAMEGFAGIPQEVRLLFRGLSKIDSVRVNGMVQHPHRILSRGVKEGGWFSKILSPAKKINRYSRVIISLAEVPYRNVLEMTISWISKKLSVSWLFVRTFLGIDKIQLTRFEAKTFEDFTWRTFFAKTLPASDYSLVSGADHYICSMPWKTMHMAGLASLNIFDTANYPHLVTDGFDVFIAQTPFPGNISRTTRMVVRYHDAIPIFMPHTIPEKSIHQATHFHGLLSNFRAGAWFSCVSAATRNDLLRIIPEAAERSVVIHNMVSHHYFLEESPFSRVAGIVRARLNLDGEHLVPKFLTLREQEAFYRKNLPAGHFRYLMIVSTVEPRKNHTRLLAAWEVLKADVDPGLKLVIVGALGWDCDAMVKGFRPWIDRGDIFMLSSVPAPDLRVLYHHAAATVCPSLGEGFDFSGVESMASGGVTVASDIPVHREVYDDAAEYFDPYSTISLVKALKAVLYDEAADGRRDNMRRRGQEVSARYTPERILPQWEGFLARLVQQDSV